MSFKFRLQSYLDIKEKLEEQKRNEYGQAMAELSRERERKEIISRERLSRLEEFKLCAMDRIEVESMTRQNQYIELLKRREAKQEDAVKAAETETDRVRAELAQKMAERKMVETLKDKDREVYNDEEKRKEQKLSDEVTSFRYATRNTNIR